MYIWILSNKFDLKQTIRVLHRMLKVRVCFQGCAHPLHKSDGQRERKREREKERERERDKEGEIKREREGEREGELESERVRES